MKIHSLPSQLINPNHHISIILIGCGGTGSLMLSRLARIDYALKASNMVGLDVTVYDDDLVEEYNIGRQMFSISDVGENKAVAICSKINRNFLTTFQAVPEKYTFGEKQKKANIYITAVDNAQFRIEFNTFFKMAKASDSIFYWMDLGNGKDNAQCILGSTNIDQNNVINAIASLPTIIDRFPNLIDLDTVEIQGQGCSSYSEKLNEQNLFINDTLSSFASNLLWEMLTIGYITKFGFFLNNRDLKCNPILN